VRAISVDAQCNSDAFLSELDSPFRTGATHKRKPRKLLEKHASLVHVVQAIGGGIAYEVWHSFSSSPDALDVGAAALAVLGAELYVVLHARERVMRGGVGAEREGENRRAGTGGWGSTFFLKS